MKQIKSEPEQRFHRSLVKFAGVPVLSLLIALRVSSLIWPSSDRLSIPQPACIHTHTQTHVHVHIHISPLLSHEVLVCYQSDFLSQIFISNQSS